MENTYSGHGANTGGLQQHSIGGTYPWIVYAQETRHGLRYGVMHANGNTDSGAQWTNAVAQDMAKRLQVESAKLRTEGDALDLSRVRYGNSDPIPEGSQFGMLCNSDPFKVGAAYAMRAARLPESIINRHTGG